MKKSNWLIIGILLLMPVIYLLMWSKMGTAFTGKTFELTITIIWWVVIIAICVVIIVTERRRMKSVRTAFISAGLIYNSETGVIKVDDGETYTDALEDILSGLKYGFSRQRVTNNSRIRFTYVVRTDKFSNHGRVWEGDVVKVSAPDRHLSFKSKEELTDIIG